MSGTVNSVRRYYLLKAFSARDREERTIEGVWRAKQAEIAGTSLAADFPARAKLVAAGYSTVEDLRGATADELRKRASLSRREAAVALATLEAQ